WTKTRGSEPRGSTARCQCFARAADRGPCRSPHGAALVSGQRDTGLGYVPVHPIRLRADCEQSCLLQTGSIHERSAADAAPHPPPPRPRILERQPEPGAGRKAGRAPFAWSPASHRCLPVGAGPGSRREHRHLRSPVSPPSAERQRAAIRDCGGGMKTPRRRFLQTAAALAAAAAGGRGLLAAGPRFEVAPDGFRLDGRAFLIRSGSMHYPRVPRPYWRDRMRKLHALGLNTLCTYVFWNAHEPQPGKFDFSGNLDLAAYIRTARQEGLWVILRPGPYICTEWDFGGFPAWLLAPPAMPVRSADPRFLAAAERYMRQVGREIRDLQVTRGGPILLAQVENEYGSYGRDHAYMAAIRGMMEAAGFEVPLYTADGPSPRLLAGGTLP